MKEIIPKRKSMPLDEFIKEQESNCPNTILIEGTNCAVLWNPTVKGRGAFLIVVLDGNRCIPGCHIECNENVTEKEMAEMVSDFFPAFIEWEDIEIRRKWDGKIKWFGNYDTPEKARDAREAFLSKSNIES